MLVRRCFAYWREPLCVLAAALYVGNRLWLKPCTADPASFVHCYLGDVLCLPVLLPVTLWLQRSCGLRGHDGAPTAGEWLQHWLLWSMCFEWLGPSLPLLAPGAVRDPWDAVAYGAGGLVAGLVWRDRCVGARRGAVRSPDGRSGWTQRLARAALAVAVAAFVLSAYRLGARFG
ncbi:MAG: hypothetical protein KAI24_00820 [Planctomycetes bacterium]|nr:hypothetical protein [Planctomycetota bacterium]